MSLLHDAYVALLSGLTTQNNRNEIYWKNNFGKPITIEIIDAETEIYIVRGYYGMYHGKWESCYKGDELHGIQKMWDRNGYQWLSNIYENGKLI